jgi:hypothetical protein
MATLPIRDPIGDHLLTPQNAALLVIDYQPGQFGAVGSMDRDILLDNIVSTAKIAKLSGRRRDRRYLRGGAPGRARAGRERRRPAGYLDPARRRAAA